MLTKTVIGVTERAGAGGGDAGLTAQLVITFIVLTISLVMQVYFRPYASMIERADIIHEPYTFTIRGGKRLHGVHFEPMSSVNERGLLVYFADDDAKYAPVCDDEFQGHKGSVDGPIAHRMRMGDILTHIDGMVLPHVFAHTQRRTLARSFTTMLHITKDAPGTIEEQLAKYEKEGSTGEFRLDLPTIYSYIDACGKNGCSIQINRELRYHGSNHGSIMGTKRGWSPEDKLATFLGIFSLITLILGLVNPPSPQQAYSSVKEARDMLQEGKTPQVNETTTEAGGIVILVLLFLMLGLGVLHTLYLLVKSQWWHVKEFFANAEKETDEKKLKVEQNTILQLLKRVKSARDVIKEKMSAKRGLKSISAFAAITKTSVVEVEEEEEGEEI